MLMERELLKISPMAQLVSVDYGDPYAYLTSPIRINVQYVIPNYATITGDEIIFTPLLAANLFKNSIGHLSYSTSLIERKFPFRDRCSRIVELNEKVKLPKGCELIYRPEVYNFNGKVASYSGIITMEGDQNLRISQKIVLNKRVYEAKDWEEFRKAVASENKLAEEPVILNIKK